MNVRLPQPRNRVLLFLLLIAFGAPRLVSAQSAAFKNLATSVNTQVADTVAGIGLMVYKVGPVRKHGDISIRLIQTGGSGNPRVYKISYQPDPGFTGVDTFTLQYTYINNYPYLVYQAYQVKVYPSLLIARPDYAVTTAGDPVVIDVLSNDTGNGTLSVSTIPLVNNGTASINASGQVVFTPASGFTGVAHLNYVVCDASNYCKTSYADIGVHSNASPFDDSLRVATAKNTKLSIPLTYSGYSVFQVPANGTVLIENGQAFRYTPNNNFTGVDQFVLSNDSFGTTVYKTIIVDVLNTASQNKMAMDDQVFTPKGQPITFNVRSNDIGNLLVKSWVTPNGLPGTISGTNGAGNVTFTPTAGFTGVATFYYRLGNQYIPNLETGTVNVVVGNLPPVLPTFELTTPLETPFVINYKIPFTGFSFSILDAPDHGTCSYFPGYSTHTINGQTFSGNNLMIYFPSNGYTGTDEFELNYCVTANGQCQSVKIVMNIVDVFGSDPPYCINDCVWAGDINKDGIVNNKDLLPLGYFAGLDGTERQDASLEWYGQSGGNWNNPFTGQPVDVKHADTDGNGVINNEDTLALSLFYGQTDNLLPYIPPVSKGLPFSLNILTPNPQIGDLVQIEVVLGSAALPVTDLYGFTFDVSLSPNIVDSALRMSYYDNTWLNLNAPSLWMGKNPHQGRLETAFTRTSGVSTNGYGVVGQFDFIIIDIVDGGKPAKNTKQSFSVMIDSPTLLSGNGNLTSGNNLAIEIPIGSNERSQTITAANSDFIVYPSPASDRLRIHLNGSDVIESLSIFDATGREVYNSGDVQLEHTELDISNLAEGFYVASARTSTGNVVRKFQILR
ncbi:MAG TPA: Ig-like domain-containing protein [Saprospiraceae bacterium]|nr:Ig-like domain-containing protein [Saprospiraceae bacterium]